MNVEDALACDVAIVGGGPAGLSAAVELRRLGIGSVCIIERESEAGGTPRHCGHLGFGMSELGRVLRGPDYARRLLRRAEDADVRVLTRTTVTSLAPGPELSLATEVGVRVLRARRVLLSTGIRERSRAARLIGGTKPAGVLSTGALQGLVYLDHLKPFRRPVVIGSELVSFSALLTCRHAGIRPVAMIEQGPRVLAWTGSSLLAHALGVPVLLDTQVTSILGVRHVEAVSVRGTDGRTSTIATDGVIVSGQFVPEASLVRASHIGFDPSSGGPKIDGCMRTTDPDYFAAGNLLRPVETAAWCWEEGRTAARLLAASLAGRLPEAKPGVRLKTGGEPVKLAVPQILVPGRVQGAPTHIQLRVTRPVHGRLEIRSGGQRLWSQRIRALPERRVLVPLDWLEAGMSGDAEISITDEAA